MALAQKQTTFPHLELNELTAVQLEEDFDCTQQIAAHLQQQLERFGTGHPPTVGLPSALALSFHYQRNVLDILDALFELKKQHYEYKMNGLDGEILLWDPGHHRPKQTRHHWHQLIRPAGELTHQLRHMLCKHLLWEV